MRSVNKQDAERFSTGSTGSDDSARAGWRVSSRCSHGDCVQVGSLPARSVTVRSVTERFVAVRDTKNRGAGPDLVFAPTAWRSFVAGVKIGPAAS